MGAILEKTVARAVTKGWIPSNEAEPVKARIGTLAEKFGFSVDDFAIATLTESYGMDPKAGCSGGGCFGIIQFCAETGLRTTGKSKAQICAESILQQLEDVDKFFSAFPKTANAGTLDLADLYLAILYPDSVGTKDMNATIPAGRQADNLYGPDHRITKNSLIAGLTKHAGEVLGGPIPSSEPARPGIPGDYAAAPAGSQALGAVGIISGVFNSNCTEPFPVSFNLKEALTYVGCQVKIASATLGGSGYGTPAPAGGSLAPNSTVAAIGGAPYSGPIPAGGFVRPVLGLTGTIPGQEYGAPRPYKGGHSGQDFEAPEGTPVWVMADGKVTFSAINSGYGNQIAVDHGNNLSSSYSHLSVRGVNVGDTVTRGQVIAKSGSTGAGGKSGSYKPHLHFMVFINGVHQPPLKYVSRKPPAGVA